VVKVREQVMEEVVMGWGWGAVQVRVRVMEAQGWEVGVKVRVMEEVARGWVVGVQVEVVRGLVEEAMVGMEMGAEVEMGVEVQGRAAAVVVRAKRRVGKGWEVVLGTGVVEEKG
jgi:hypothetical protein